MALNIILAALLLLSTPALADFEAGCDAFDRGDYAAALEEWQPLAEQGHAQAKFRLGCLYAFGQGVPQNDAEALRLFIEAAEQGDGDAQNNLGGMYSLGWGVEPDLIAAYMWFEIAARSGHDMASRNRTYIAEILTPEQIGSAEKLAGEWQASHPQ